MRFALSREAGRFAALHLMVRFVCFLSALFDGVRRGANAGRGKGCPRPASGPLFSPLFFLRLAPFARGSFFLHFFT